MPPISNDLLLAAALTSAIPGALAANPDTNRPRTGVATTVTSNAARGATSNTVYIDGTTNERLTTDANSTLHVLFSDQSALMIGPNSELMIARYEFDNKTKNGQILIDMTKGFLRVVGGFISKKNDVQIRTASATVGIRGAVAEINVSGGQTNANFVFGQSLNITPSGGGTPQTINRAGFSFSAGGSGPITLARTPPRVPPSSPGPVAGPGAPAPVAGPGAPAPVAGANPPAPAPTTVQVTGLVNNLSSTRLADPNIVNNITLNTGGGGGGGGVSAPVGTGGGGGGGGVYRS